MEALGLGSKADWYKKRKIQAKLFECSHARFRMYVMNLNLVYAIVLYRPAVNLCLAQASYLTEYDPLNVDRLPNTIHAFIHSFILSFFHSFIHSFIELNIRNHIQTWKIPVTFEMSGYCQRSTEKLYNLICMIYPA